MDINIFEKVSLKGCIAFTIMCFENTENTEDLYSSGILSLKICSDQKKHALRNGECADISYLKSQNTNLPLYS